MSASKKDLDSSNMERMDKLREQYRKLLVQNPNYFGKLETSKLKAVFPLKHNTAYEELGSVGYHPETERLEAVVYIKRPTGYGGGVCRRGTPEFVRFFASLDGKSWEDLGLASFTAWDIPGTDAGRRRLEYAVTLRHRFRRQWCRRAQIVRIRAILEWNEVPDAGNPDHIPTWGDRHDTHILIAPRRRPPWGDIVGELGDQIAALKDLIDEKAEIPLKMPQPPSSKDLLEHYAGTDVSHARLIFPQAARFGEFAGVRAHKTGEIELVHVQDVNIPTEGIFEKQDDTHYEELESIGYDPRDDSVVGIIRIKQALGYLSGLCGWGSKEYVTFWADLEEDGTFETCLGTAQVSVYDVREIPDEGLEFAVHLPADLIRLRIPCREGARTIRVRATLSWASPIPCDEPDRAPTWGNRLETRVHVPPGRRIPDNRLEPILSSIGGIIVDEIVGGVAQNAVAITTGGHFAEAPFGGRINLAGKIVNGGPSTRYRVMIREQGGGAFTPLGLEPHGISVHVVTPGPVFTQTTLHADADGYYAYQDYSSNHYVEGNILAVWHTGSVEHGKVYELRIDVQDPANPATDMQSEIVAVEIDNEAPEVSLAFTSLAGDCAHFGEGAVFTGTFSATDPHFRSFAFEILPTGPAHGVKPLPAGGASIYFTGGTIADPGVVSGTFTLDTTGMDPCGYALVLHAADRTNVNSGAGHNHSKDSVGFCLGSPPRG